MRLLLVYDQRAMAEALALALGSEHQVIGLLCEHHDVMAWLQLHQVDLVLIDAALPHCNMFELIRTICIRHKRTQVVVMSAQDEGTDWPGIRRMGAHGVISKAAGLESFRQTLLELAAKDKPSDDGAPSLRALAPTARHLDVLHSIMGGASRKRIATELHLSRPRIDELISEIKHRLGAENWGDMVLRAIDQGWIEPRVPPPPELNPAEAPT